MKSPDSIDFLSKEEKDECMEKLISQLENLKGDKQNCVTDQIECAIWLSGEYHKNAIDRFIYYLQKYDIWDCRTPSRAFEFSLKNGNCSTYSGEEWLESIGAVRKLLAEYASGTIIEFEPTNVTGAFFKNNPEFTGTPLPPKIVQILTMLKLDTVCFVSIIAVIDFAIFINNLLYLSLFGYECEQLKGQHKRDILIEFAEEMIAKSVSVEPMREIANIVSKLVRYRGIPSVPMGSSEIANFVRRYKEQLAVWRIAMNSVHDFLNETINGYVITRSDNLESCEQY